MTRLVVVDAYAGAFLNFRRELITALVGAGNEVIAAAPDFDLELRTAVARLGATPMDIDLERTGCGDASACLFVTHPVDAERLVLLLIKTRAGPRSEKS